MLAILLRPLPPGQRSCLGAFAGATALGGVGRERGGLRGDNINQTMLQISSLSVLILTAFASPVPRCCKVLYRLIKSCFPIMKS